MWDTEHVFSYSTSIYSYNIHWTRIGDVSSPPLVFVHGTPWSSIVWEPVATQLSRHFCVYLSDNPGFGRSPLGKPLPDKQISKEQALDADLASQSEVFAALLQSWARESTSKPHVVAHDHAGLMTLRAFLLHGCQYASLCLIDVVAVGPFGKPLFKLVAENENVFKQLSGSVFEGVVESYIRDAAHIALSPQDMEALKRPWLESEESQHAFIRQMVQANSRNTDAVEPRYAEVGKAIPVKVIWGAEDKWLPVSEAQRVGEKVGAKEIAIVDGAGHLIMYDQGARLGVELGMWLGSLQR
jgi:pimeloyl-ACP methyl ester carboxylesterase